MSSSTAHRAQTPSRPWAITIWMAVALVVAGCAGGSDPEGPSTPRPTSASDAGGASATDAAAASGDPSGSPAPTGQGACAPDAADQEIPRTAPHADAWEDVHGFLVPVSDTVGPTDRSGAVWECFAHSPTGALFAASYIHPGAMDPEIRQAYITDLSPEGAQETAGATSGTVRLVGYEYLSYAPDRAAVTLLYKREEQGTSAFVAVPVTVFWVDGRWTSTMAAFEENNRSIEVVTSTERFVAWSAQP